MDRQASFVVPDGASAACPGPRSYRMHTSRLGVHPMRPTAGLRGPSPPFRRPREGGDLSLTPDAAAAGGELVGLPKLPREPRLGSEAGATPAFARAGGWGNATPRHRTEMCESGRTPIRGRSGTSRDARYPLWRRPGSRVYRIHTSLRTPLRAPFPLIPSSGASRVSRACPEPAEGDGGPRFGAVLRYAPAGAVATQDEGKGLAAKGAKARAARPSGAPQTSRNEMCESGRLAGRGDPRFREGRRRGRHSS